MEEIDVLCINCENMISVDKISAHSSVCVTPTNYIIKLSSANPIKLLDFRLDKLKCSMEAILHDSIKPLSTDEKMIFTYLSRYTVEILSIKESSVESSEACKKISIEIANYPVSNISPCVSLYLERVRAIAKEKGSILLEESRVKESSMNLSALLENRASQIDGLNKQIQKFKQAHGDTDAKVDCLEICSAIDEMHSKTSITSSIVSPRDNKQQFELDELDHMFEAQEKEISQKSNEDLQKYFYSKCLIMKLGYSSRDPAQFIQIPDLYRRVREKAIPVDMWEDFIKEQFQKPELWIKKK
ncbi:hypothetical protein SteCoe_34331 [Stentor coeruleus]|uniref:Uncharacterized protein n=1 Tax=Stentor coeruleus TaxID=5963 RepID=A0A1R2AUY1_9CILI|nr:hypothetical protein SteCoe_34331 [Stentor coeruleus]